MSYDLYFTPRTGSVTLKQFSEYFTGRAHYQVNLPQASYQNEDTGVYFVFDLNDPDEAGEGELHYPVSLNINFYRPSYFVLEAEPEVTAFVRAFDMVISDPQVDGIGDGQYDPERLISGWNAGNEFGYKALLSQPESAKDVHSRPTSVLMDMWRWNLNIQALQLKLGESRFVPMVLVILLAGRACTAAVWPDGIPIAAPKVDYLIVPRKELAPRRLFRRVEDIALLAWDDALPILNKHRSPRFTDFVLLDYDWPPTAIKKFVKSLPTDASGHNLLSRDQVLDRELVEKYVAAAPGRSDK